MATRTEVILIERSSPGERLDTWLRVRFPTISRGAFQRLIDEGQVLVLNKPPGLVVHPASGHETQTLVNALLHHCKGQLSGIGGVARPGIVHRLDKETSGCLVVAKNDSTHLALAA